MDLSERFREIEETIAKACIRSKRLRDSVTLVTVTKTHPTQTVQAVLDSGHLDIGENHVQEIVEKVPKLSGAKIVHLIGHLQSNKVKKAVALSDWIHSVDSIKLLEQIETECHKQGRNINILVQVNTSNENTKFGCPPSETITLGQAAANCHYATLRGLMTMGPLNATPETIRKSFALLKNQANQLQDIIGKPLELSMGMSDDFEIAIEEGSTIIRVGSRILGQREVIK